MWRALEIAWRIVWGVFEVSIVIYVVSAINDRNTGLIVGVLGLIYATVRVNFLHVDQAFMLLGQRIDQRFYELERLRDPQKRRPDSDPAFTRFYVDASIAWVFLALVYLVCLLSVFFRL